ncbi:hotdog fold thioesterase [Alcanivorax quisquiliarum]|uniref:Hotdog fold thioesterase n=1 Tax=Alcanivorax quisquiliarum TaxID=2933565 RepID=A0ABT0E2W7_9GAMM|nr:hotdog fold thioesterase [Alcanivorax quisquiliarum]MCK0536154.1 hotdog fold thioesterase [Alcanivorax quisquiliarum]
MAIWRVPVDIDRINAWQAETINGVLGITVTEVGEDSITGTMPVDRRTHQPMGILHGGASVVLAESLGSMAANYCVDPATHYCVGLDINANHLRSVRAGLVTGVASPIHIGRTTQVWEIRISDEAAKPVCIARLTLAVLAHDRSSP